MEYQVLTAAPSPVPQPAVGSEFEIIPLKFTLVGVNSDNASYGDFQDAMQDKLKEILALVSTEIDGLKIIEVDGSIFGSTFEDPMGSEYTVDANSTSAGAAGAETSEGTRTYHLYFDAKTVVSDTMGSHGPIVIQTVRDMYADLLQQFQEYDPVNYYYASDFDLCTTLTGALPDEDRMFTLCSQDHQIVPLKFKSLAFPKGIDRDIFKEQLMDFYQDLLGGIDGFGVTGIYDDKLVEVGKSIDMYFDVDVIQKDQDMTRVITEIIDSDDAKNQVLDFVQAYTIEQGYNIEWCITETGRYSTEPCVVSAEGSTGYDFQLPFWLIITIAAASGVIALGICLWVCIIARQQAQEEDEFKHNFRTYIADPEEWRKGQYPTKKQRRKKGRVDRYSHDYRRMYSRPPMPPMRHQRRRRSRSSLYDKYKSGRRLRRSESSAIDYIDTLRTIPDSDEEYQMVLYQEPTYPQHYRDPRSLPQLPPAQPPYLRIEGRQSAQPGLSPRQPQNQLKQEELLQIKGPVYCDDNFVNRPDPPPGPVARNQIARPR